MVNRHERRAEKHGQETFVEREIPVLMMLGADGAQEMILPDAEACNSCRCCVIWTRDLQFIRDAIVKHENEHHGKAFRKLDDCPICLAASGGWDSKVVGRG